MIYVLTTMSLGGNYLDPHFLFLFSREPSNRTPCERPQKWLSKKEIFECFFKTPLFLGKWCGVATYFFI